MGTVCPAGKEITTGFMDCMDAAQALDVFDWAMDALNCKDAPYGCVFYEQEGKWGSKVPYYNMAKDGSSSPHYAPICKEAPSMVQSKVVQHKQSDAGAYHMGDPNTVCPAGKEITTGFMDCMDAAQALDVFDWAMDALNRKDAPYGCVFYEQEGKWGSKVPYYNMAKDG